MKVPDKIRDNKEANRRKQAAILDQKKRKAKANEHTRRGFPQTRGK
jgi:hypothetical protein